MQVLTSLVHELVYDAAGSPGPCLHAEHLDMAEVSVRGRAQVVTCVCCVSGGE